MYRSQQTRQQAKLTSTNNKSEPQEKQTKIQAKRASAYYCAFPPPGVQKETNRSATKATRGQTALPHKKGTIVKRDHSIRVQSHFHVTQPQRPYPQEMRVFSLTPKVLCTALLLIHHLCLLVSVLYNYHSRSVVPIMLALTCNLTNNRTPKNVP